MFFQKKKTELYLRLLDGTNCLYDGPLRYLPLPETIILQKSIEFYDDSEPCHIHRSAVRNRLLFEIEEELGAVLHGDEASTRSCHDNCCPLLTCYTGFSGFTLISCYRK